MKKFKHLIYVVGIMVVALMFNVYGGSFITTPVNAQTNNISFEKVTLSNADFNNSPYSTTLDKNPSGWTKIKTSSPATSGVVNVGEKYSANAENYQLEGTSNPGKASSSYDDKILMINAKNSEGAENATSQGYKSSDISFSAYSFYEVSVLVKTINSAHASVILNGFDDEITTNQFTNITANGWTEYTFFVQTNIDAVTANLELYLGATPTTNSVGAVFYDNINIIKVSEKRFAQDILEASNFTVVANEINYVELPSSEYNFDFEQGSTVNSWTIEGGDSLDFTAKVFDLTNSSNLISLGLPNVGTDNSYDNKYGLVLSLDEDNSGYVGFTSNKSIQIEQFGLYKISMNVKAVDINGKAFIKLIENNDVNEFYGKDVEFYTPTTNSIEITTTSDNALKNDYNTVSFYVKGHSLYNTSVKLGLFLGDKDNASHGTIVFDNITVEKLSSEQMSEIATNNTNKEISFTTVTGTPSVTNGFFNEVTGQTVDGKFPLEAKDWKQTASDDVLEGANDWGVVNTNQTAWNNNGLTLGNPQNPTTTISGTPITTPISDTNNILIMYNSALSYQTVESPKITLAKDSYYTLSFDFKTSQNNILNVYLKDGNDLVIFEDTNLSSFNWKNYSITLKTQYYGSDVKLVLELGTKDNKVQGVAYFDNIISKTETYTDEQFTTLLDNPKNNVVDFSNYGINIKSEETNANGVYDAFMFDGKLENGNQNQDNIAFGGIITEDNIFGVEFPETNTNLSKNMLVVSNITEATYSLTTKSKIELSANSYYKFSVYIKTDFENTPVDTEDKTYVYGANFAIPEFDTANLTNIKSDEFTKYEIFIYTKSSTSVTVKLGLVSDDALTTGNAYFDNLMFESITEQQFRDAVAGDKIAVYAAQELDAEEDEEETTPEANPTSATFWIGLSSIILVLAMVAVIIIHYFKKIHKSSVKRKRKNSVGQSDYDRKSQYSRDAFVHEAEKRRTQDIKKQEAELAKVKEQISELEKQNKERVEEHRKEHGKTITRKSEREFKSYVSARNRLNKEIERIEYDIDYMHTPDYLLYLQRQIQNEKLKEQKKNFDKPENIETKSEVQQTQEEVKNEDIKPEDKE